MSRARSPAPRAQRAAAAAAAARASASSSKSPGPGKAKARTLGGRRSYSPPPAAATTSRVAVLGPVIALMAIPKALVPQSLEGLSTLFGAVVLLLSLGALLSLTGIPVLAHAADSVIDRTINARRNWENDTLRSFLEVFGWLYFTLEVYQQWHAHPLAVAAVGGLAGLGMVAIGDMLTGALRGMERRFEEDNGALKSWKFGHLATPEVLALSAVLTFGVGMRFRNNTDTVTSALVTPLLASLSLVVLGQLLQCWNPTHRIGDIIHDRLVHAGHNWREHTLRSGFETSLWLSATWASFAVMNDVMAATVLGSIAGLLTCVVGDLMFTDNFSATAFAELRDSSGTGLWSPSAPARHNAPPTDSDLVWREQAGVSGQYTRFYAPKNEAKAARVQDADFSMLEVAAHDKRDDCWVAIEGKVYDITRYVNLHPGGWLPISHLAGRDATDAFTEYHPASVWKTLLPTYCIGNVKAEAEYTETNAFVKDMREIRQVLLANGLFETRPSFYVKQTLWLTFLFTMAVGLTVTPEVGFRGHIVGAFFMALFWQQLAFIGHDIGHNSVSHVRLADNFWGVLLGNTLGGISLGWWKRNHNTHHVICNSVDHDPDIQHMPIFAVSEKIFGKFWSTYYEKWVVTDLPARLLVSYQQYLFYPVMFIARFNLYVQSWLMLLSTKKAEYKKLEIATLAVFALWVGALVSQLPTWQERITWLVLSHGFAGILHVQICISHFPMETFRGGAYAVEPEEKDSTEWFRLQLRTSMNVDCPTWMDWFHGGLQFQVEHHIYPRVPRHNLRKVRDMVRAVCAKHNVPYHEADFIGANVLLVKAMAETAKKARNALKQGEGGHYIYEAEIWDGLNARG